MGLHRSLTGMGPAMPDAALAASLGRGGFAAAAGAYHAEAAAVAVCLVLLAFCSLVEAALVRVEPGRVRQLVAEKRRGARRLSHLVEHRQEVLNSIVLLINAAVIAASAYTTQLTIRASGGSGRWVPAASAGMILTMLVLCELTPKMYSVRRAEAVGLAAAPVLTVLHTLLRPFGRALYLLAMGVIRRVIVPVFGGETTPSAVSYSDEEILALVSAGQAHGEIEQGEKEMIRGVIGFADTVTREVMTPRTDVACVPAEATLLEAARVSQETGFSRLPVYEKDVDHIIGILYAKDMVSALGSAAGPVGQSAVADSLPGQTVDTVARKPAPVVPESKKVSEVLRLMQRDRLHMAIVIDEYGGTAGLVTIEDLLEEIFGELSDEYDLSAEPVRVLSEDVLIVDARVSADEIRDRLGVTLPEGDYDSVGGFILDQLGRLPAAGETVVWRNLEFAVEAVSENRILRVRVARKPEEEEEDEDAPREA